MILGIDEVGRGVWAGPLVVGAVVLGGAQIEGLNDSKLLTKKRREQLYEEVYASGAGIGLGWVSPAEIDDIGLSQALRLATKRAVQDVGASFHEIIIDGTVNFLAGTALESHVTLMKKADQLVPSVSAASIVAKVARDRYMAEQDEIYSGYKFAQHVGYGTAIHRAALAEYGVTPLHRRSVAPVRLFCDSSPLVLARETGVTQPAAKTTRVIGDLSESAACAELERRGHEIVARNWKTKWCEIDIVSRRDDCYYFSEVKHRKNDKAGNGLAAITPKKLNQMSFAAELFISKHDLQNHDRLLLAIATTGDSPQVVEIVDAM